MNFWHMQLHPDNSSLGQEKDILKKTKLIGIGIWEDPDEDKIQERKFDKQMKVGDVVAIKRGGTIIALTKVVGECAFEENIDRDLDWFQRRRKVEILDWYSEEYGYYIAPTAALTRCNMAFNDSVRTNDSIKKWYEKVMNDSDINEVIDLLKYKHQVILQGPPGTGKTRLAKLVAERIAQPENKGSSGQLIDNLIQSFDVDNSEAKFEREKRQQLLSSFYKTFPKEKINDLTLESYCIGTGENNSFCWWIERGLQSLGYYFPGSSLSYKVYWSKAKDVYSKHGFVKDIEDDELAMTMVAETIHDLVNNHNTEQAFERFGNSFVLKVLQSYYPEEYFPINSETAIDNALKLLKSYDESLSLLDKNKKLTEIYLDKKKQFNSEITKHEFARIIWDNFDLKSGQDLTQSNEVRAQGKYEIIQFHPAYTYEDFVRGIVASSDEGGISYHVENKKLAEIAQEACDNPNGNYVLIVDEINRANLPSVLGELIYALEYRGEAIQTMYEHNKSRDIKLPKNLYVIGTMNTADRSVGHIDYAIRRRFAFYNVLPNLSVVKNKKAQELFQEVSSLFDNKSYLSSDFDANDVRIGHSYFIPSSEAMTEDEFEIELKQKLKYEIKPILYEYIKDGILLDSAKEVVKNLHV